MLSPSDSQKIVLVFTVLLIISIIWSSLFIIKNPYTYPSNFWLNFMGGFVAYIVVLLIDSTLNLQIISIFQYVLLTISLILNAVVISNTYRKYVTIPVQIIPAIVSLNGFMSAHIINYMLSLKKSTPQTKAQTIATTTQGTTQGTTRMTTQGTTMITTKTPQGTTILTPAITTTTPQGTTIVTPITTKVPQGTTMIVNTPTMTPSPLLTPTPTPTPKLLSANLPTSLRSLNNDIYDFGAFDISEERADVSDMSYYTDYQAQLMDEEDLYVEDDYAEDDYIEDDYIEDDYVEDDYIEEY